LKKRLLEWYRYHGRDLPWRNTIDPYSVWISEVLLQQTRVQQALSYFNRFMTTFPDLESLAKASLDAVLDQWQGLGYYRRAELLHRGAIFIQKEFNGIFPNQYEQLLQVPGIGSYTAAAIASISFNHPYIALDGNLKRIAARLGCVEASISSSEFEKRAYDEISHIFPFENPGLGNQALMDLGSMICLPKKAKCRDCPLNNICCAFLTSTPELFPTKNVKRQRQSRYFWYLIHQSENKVAFYQRPSGDIWSKLWEFPMVETFTSSVEDFLGIFHKQYPHIQLSIVKIIPLDRPHILSHQSIYAMIVVVENSLHQIPNVHYFNRENLPPSSVLVKKILTLIF